MKSEPQPRNPLRAALERFGRERGQPQPTVIGSGTWNPDPYEKTSTAADQAEIERRRKSNSTLREQGQPQQEPANADWVRAIDEAAPGRFIDIEPLERQAGVHQRGELYENYRNLEQTIYRCSCARGWHDADFWQGFDAGYEKAMLDAIASHPKKKGVADAAASKERHAES